MAAGLVRVGFALIGAAAILLGEVVADVSGRAAAVSARVQRATLVDASVRDGGEIALEEIGKVKRGKEHVLVVAQAGGADRVCKLKLKYQDGNADSPDDVVSGKDGSCTIFFDVPDRESVVGNAIAKLRVETEKGRLKGKATRTFSVKS